jgi:hypothetical protein
VNTYIETRAIEIHDTQTMWNPQKMKKIVDFMVRYHMNTLILHENDIVDKVVFPAMLYTSEKTDGNIYGIYQKIYEKIYEMTPSPFVFCDEKGIFVELLRKIIRDATSRGIRVFLQTKELWHSDLLYHSPVAHDGILCPTDPFWWESYLPAKYTELFETFPELSGIVTSTGTRESRTSLAHGRCKCERCQKADLHEWQKKIIMAIYGPIKKYEKQLVVRDFTYYASEQEGLRAGVLELPDDVVVSIKNTPQDFYPTFPDNKLIGHVDPHEQWIEYEVMGEYFGFGVLPCSLIEDIRHRIKYALAHGAKGFTARVDWEALPNHSVFDTINALNVYACAMLSLDSDLPARDLYEAWLSDYELFAPGRTKQEKRDCIEKLASCVESSWDVIRQSCYINGYLFSSNSKIPADIRHGMFLAREHHGMQKWFPEREHDFDMTKENIRNFVEEKEAAVRLADSLYAQIRYENPGLREDYYEQLVRQFELTVLYTEQFRCVALVFLNAVGKEALNDKAGAFEALHLLTVFEKRLKEYRFPVFDYPASVLLSYEKLHYFRLDAERVLKELYA